MKVSEKMGRPPKGEESRKTRLNIRISDNEAKRIQMCADFLEISRVDAIMRGIDLLEATIIKK